jgi:hypothetical protein
MEINHRFEFVTGSFNTEKGQLICVRSDKYAEVKICFKEGMYIPFAKIKLHSKDRFVDAKAVLDDAYELGQEICKRWNAYNQQPETNNQ